jgi:hypothetical protein
VTWLRTVELRSLIAAAIRAAPWLWVVLVNAVLLLMRTSSNLPVTTSNDIGVGALRSCEVEETNTLGNSRSAGSTRKEILNKTSGVGATNTLNPEAADLASERSREYWAKAVSLFVGEKNQ